MTFAPQKVETIYGKNHHSVKQNKIRTQVEICYNLWSGIRGSVVTSPGQAIARMCHLYYGITDGFYHPIHFYELDYPTFNKMKDNLIDYMEYCDHVMDFSEIRTVNGNIADAPPMAVEDLDFCCAPHTVGRIVLDRLRNQQENYVGPKGFSYTIYEVPGSEGDSVRLMNNVIKFLGGTPLASAQQTEMHGLHSQQYVVFEDRDYNRSPELKSFAYKYQPPIHIDQKGSIEDARWFRYRDRSCYISNTFAVRYT
ncbi:MAG: hypothetical protein U9Q21_04695 [Candidatus Auribacterota bacterium]|nr:hypothetical protein [Candidatus Auribacterota bacterium]